MKKFKRFFFLLLTTVILLTAVTIPASAAKASAVVAWSTPVAGGTSHSIALKDGTLWAWGSNQQLQTGFSSVVTEQPIPVQVDTDDISMFVSVSAGYDFSLALRYDGSVYVLGEKGSKPVYQVPGLSGILAVAAGQTNALALDNNGVVWQWVIGETPRRVPNLNGIAAIAAGGAHFFALTYSGDVWGWGYNERGQLGDGTTIDVAAPKKVKSLANIVSIAAGYSHSLAISHDGSLYAWGSNTYGQLGDGTTEAHNLPVKVNGIGDVVQIAAGNDTSMALTKKSELYTWGYGEFGQLGNDTLTVSQNKPLKIETEGTPVFISSGVYHNFYVAKDGSLYSWGRNRNNMIGSGDNLNKTVPVKVFSGTQEPYMIPPDPFMGASTWAVAELESLYDLELLPPMLWSDYQNNVTRAEFAGLLINLHEAMKGVAIPYPDSTNFTDIGNNVYQIEIRKAYALGLVAGVSETRYNPEGEITRQEAAKMIVTFICKVEIMPEPTYGSIPYYRDAHKVAPWAVPYVAFAHDKDIMQGSGGYFNPESNLQREQILAMVYRTILKYNWV